MQRFSNQGYLETPFNKTRYDTEKSSSQRAVFGYGDAVYRKSHDGEPLRHKTNFIRSGQLHGRNLRVPDKLHRQRRGERGVGIPQS